MKFNWILFILLLSACNQVDEKQGDNSNLESFREWRVGNFHYSDGAFKYLIHRTSAYQEEFLLQE